MLNSKQKAALDIMGIDVWVSNRPAEVPLAHNINEIPEQPVEVLQQDPEQLKKTLETKHYDWPELVSEIKQCNACELSQNRNQVIVGQGTQQANGVIVTEAPGIEADQSGSLFNGESGKLLASMLSSIGLGMENVFISGIVKCRPPGNREPSESEAAQCRQFLVQQVQLVQPEVILCLGKTASNHLLENSSAINRLRGGVHRHEQFNAPVIVTYHPEYLLKAPHEKRKVWEDLVLLKKHLNKLKEQNS